MLKIHLQWFTGMCTKVRFGTCKTFHGAIQNKEVRMKKKKTRKKYVLKPRIITSYDNADWENGMTKVGPLWLIWLRCRCYCFFFSCFYEFFRRYCCCFAAHKYVHHEYCHFMFLYFSFHLFFSEKAKKIRTSTSKNSKSTKSKRE